MGDVTTNIPKFYVGSALATAYFFLPVYVIYLYQKGLSFTEIMMLEAFYAVIPVILEIPSGYFADVKGRKASLVVSLLCFIGAVAALLFGTAVWHFLVSMALWGASSAFWSGANSALVYDTLLTARQEKRYPAIWGRMLFVMYCSFAAGSVIGGYVAGVNMALTLIMNLVTGAGALLVMLSLTEPLREKRIMSKCHLHNLVHISRQAFGNRKFVFITAYNAFFAMVSLVLFLIIQPLAISLGVSLGSLGALFGLGSVVMAIGTLMGHRIAGKRATGMLLFALAAISGVSLLAVAFLKSPWALLLFLVPAAAYGMVQVAGNVIINGVTSSDRRATVLSIEGMTTKIAYAASAVFLGTVMDAHSVKLTLVIAGIAAIFGSGCCALLMSFAEKRK
ncbi:TPA: MFS transporter [Candidatus Woesearchaeota archaeon]|nr:MFS transporter [Candidatus Woesearchaeota archaeon]